MQYCDYVRDSNALDAKTAKLLGFKKVFNSTDGISIITEPQSIGPHETNVIIEGHCGYIAKYINDKRVIGMIIEDFQADRNLIEHARHKEKIIMINAGKITNSNDNYRARNLIRARELVKNALHYKIKIAISSTARNPNEVLSAGQLIELAKILGANEEQSKNMLTSLVDAL